MLEIFAGGHEGGRSVDDARGIPGGASSSDAREDPDDWGGRFPLLPHLIGGEIGTGLERNLRADVALDRLRLLWVTTMTADDFVRRIGIPWLYTGHGRHQGRRKVWESVLYLWLSKGVEGAVWCQHRTIDEMATHEVRIEFNPAKVPIAALSVIGRLLTLGLGVDLSNGFVERFDAAFDYPVEKGWFLLDAGPRKTSWHGVGPAGPETECYLQARTTVQARLYDKAAERRAKGADMPEGPLTRFELVLRPEVEIRLHQLGGVQYPERAGFLVRHRRFNPVNVADMRLAAFLSIVDAQGIRAGKAWLRRFCNSKARETFLECGLPEVRESPSEAYRRLWPDVIRSFLGAFIPNTVGAT